MDKKGHSDETQRKEVSRAEELDKRLLCRCTLFLLKLIRLNGLYRLLTDNQQILQ